jgi:hypothetical protein
MGAGVEKTYGGGTSQFAIWVRMALVDTNVEVQY